MAARQAWELTGMPLIDKTTDTVNYAFLAEVLKDLAASEDAKFWKCNEDWLKRKPFVNDEDPLDAYPLQHKDRLCHVIYTNNPTRWRSYYYKHLFHSRLHDSTIVVTACKLFVQGITWVYRYYKRLPKDPEWYYPYNYAPSLRDLANFTMGLSVEEGRRLTERFVMPPGPSGFVHPHVQLLCIMPLASAGVLPRKVKDIMTTETIGCTHMFPTGFMIQTYMKMHLWECTPVLPMLDIACFKRAIAGA
jgi:5'-3' exonuclease